jgi:hypothetical protein
VSQVSSKGAAFAGYSSAITRFRLGGDVIDGLDVNDLEKLMESMGISTPHTLVLKGLFTSWKKNPKAAFEAKVACMEPIALLPFDLSVCAGCRRQEGAGRRICPHHRQSQCP